MKKLIVLLALLSFIPLIKVQAADPQVNKNLINNIKLLVTATPTLTPTPTIQAKLTPNTTPESVTPSATPSVSPSPTTVAAKSTGLSNNEKLLIGAVLVLLALVIAQSRFPKKPTEVKAEPQKPEEPKV